MNALRTATLRYALTAAAAVAMLGTFAATSAGAQEVGRAEIRAQVLAAQGEGSLGDVAAQYGYEAGGRPLAGGTFQPRSRAEVRAATEQALARGEIDTRSGEAYGAAAASVADAGRTGGVGDSHGNTTSRAEVRAATVRALRDGSANAYLGESYGARLAPQQRATRAL